MLTEMETTKLHSTFHNINKKFSSVTQTKSQTEVNVTVIMQ